MNKRTTSSPNEKSIKRTERINILIRCDASNSIGSGHVMRCRSLGQELQFRGANVIFICRDLPGNLNQTIKKDFQILELPFKKPDTNRLDNNSAPTSRDLYQQWLGCPQSIDARETLHALLKIKTTKHDWLIVDHYGLDCTWESLIVKGLESRNRHKLKILVIDDLADRAHQANILLDQNFYGNSAEKRYQNLLPKNCKQLLGPHYALLSPEYALLHNILPRREKLLRVLIFFGGVDAADCTTKCLEALDTKEFESIHVDVVLGSQNSNRESIKQLVNKRGNTSLHNPMESLAGLMARADLAIGAGGSTTWERACLGLPSLVIAIAKNQLPIAESLSKQGYIRFLGTSKNVNISTIRDELSLIAESKWPLASGHELTDGLGTKRIASALLSCNSGINLRPIRLNDEDLLLRWANDTIVRANSLNKNKISPTEHHSWFRASLKNPDILHWIGIDDYGLPIGQIRLNRNKETKQVRLSFSLDLIARGHGLSKELLLKCLTAMENIWGNDIEVIAEVLVSNKASQACFAGANFIPDPDNKLITVWRWQADIDKPNKNHITSQKDNSRKAEVR